MIRNRLLPTLAAAALLASAGCLSGSGDQGFAVTTSAQAIHVGEQVPLRAEAQEDIAQEPAWELEELHGGGFLNSRGFQVTYVAPQSAGRYHLVVRAVRPDGTPIKQVTELVVLPSPQVEPAQARTAPGGTVAFTARMKGLPRNTVTWSVDEAGGGTIGEDGLYQAPAGQGTFHVRATSTLDRETSATATVQVE